MLDYLEAKTPLRMTAPTTFNDYYAHLPGGRRAGRSIEPAPFDAKELGAWAPRPSHQPAPALADDGGGRPVPPRRGAARHGAGRAPPDRRRPGARTRLGRRAVQGAARPRRRGAHRRGGVGSRVVGGRVVGVQSGRRPHRGPPGRGAGVRRASSGTRRWCRRSSARGSSRSARRTTRATVTAWRWRRAPRWRT